MSIGLLTAAAKSINREQDTQATHAAATETSNAAELEATGIQSAGESPAIADAMHLLGDLAPMLLPALPLSQLVLLDPLKNEDVAREVMRYSGQQIATESAELAHQLIEMMLRVGTGVEFGANVKGKIEGIPLAAESQALLFRDSAEAGRVELSRELAVKKTYAEEMEHAEASASGAVGIGQHVTFEIDMDPGEVLHALGVAACFMLGPSTPITALLEPLMMRTLEERAPSHGETRVFAAADASAEFEASTVLTSSGPFAAPGMTEQVLEVLDQDGVLSKLSAAASVGADLQLISAGEGLRAELGFGAAAATEVSIHLMGLVPGMDALAKALSAANHDEAGAMSARLVGNILPGEEHLGPGVEVILNTDFSKDGEGRAEELVFGDAFQAAGALLGEGDTTDVGTALSTSGIASLQRSVTAELPRKEEHLVVPDILSLKARALPIADALEGEHELSITASCRVRADLLAQVLRGVPAPEGKTAIEVAQEALGACIDLTRGVALPEWMAKAVDETQLLAAFELSSPRIVGRVELGASVSDIAGDELADGWDGGGMAAVVVDTPYDGEVDMVELWKRL